LSDARYAVEVYIKAEIGLFPVMGTWLRIPMATLQDARNVQQLVTATVEQAMTANGLGFESASQR
jgi:hypothetical protein